MHNRNKEIFNHIACEEQHETYWGNEVITWLCPDGQVDLLVYAFRKSAYLICKEKQSREHLNILVELFSYLRYAEENHLIYVTKAPVAPVRIYNFYENHKELANVTLPTDYSLGKGQSLHDDAKVKFVYKSIKPQEKILSEYIDVSFLYGDIEHFLFGRIHAAHGLKKFIEHDYLSDQDYYANLSLRTSRWSIGVAIGIAVLSPIMTVLIGNWLGETTIVEHQYEGLKTLTTVTDTIEVEKHDTVLKIDTVRIHDTIIKPIQNQSKSKKK